MVSAPSLPDDLLIGAEDEVAIRQDLVLTALGKRPADTLLRVGRLLDVHTRSMARRPGDRDQGPAHRLDRAGGDVSRHRGAAGGEAGAWRRCRASARCTSISRARI